MHRKLAAETLFRSTLSVSCAACGTEVNRHCSPRMLDSFVKAEQWRIRAAELRVLASRMQEDESRAGLLSIASGLDHHARSLEGVAVQLGCTAPVFRANALETVGDD